jgi:hypothetical protein
MVTRGPMATFTRGVMLVAAFALVTALMTFPLVTRGAQVGPINTGDGQLSIWNVSWVARALVRDPLHVFDANIFEPHRSTLAYSEANLVAGALGIPVWWTTRNPYATYASVVFLAFLAAALAMYGLARTLTERRDAAVIAAVLFAFAPFAIVRLAHIQLLMTATLPAALFAMHRFIDRPGVARAIALAATVALAGVACGYYGIFAGFAVALGIVYYACGRGLWRQPRYIGLVALAAVGSGLLVLPFFLPYANLMGHGSPFRTLADARQYSATLSSYLLSTTHVHKAALGPLVAFEPAAFPERILFPGVLAIGGAIAALALSSRSPLPADGRSARAGLTPRAHEAVGFYVLLAVLAFWFSFGPDGGLYAVAYRFVPVWSLLRAPARFGALVALALSVLAGIGVAGLLRSVKQPTMVAAAIGVMACVELGAMPWDLRDAVPVSSVYRVLAKAPEGGVAEFPFFFRPIDFHRHSIYMLYSTYHWHPIVNGYSDYIPDDFKAMAVPVSSFPAWEALTLLQAHGARYVVFHLDLYDSRSREKLLERIERYHEYIRPISKDGEVWLFEIVKKAE